MLRWTPVATPPTASYELFDDYYLKVESSHERGRQVRLDICNAQTDIGRMVLHYFPNQISNEVNVGYLKITEINERNKGLGSAIVRLIPELEVYYLEVPEIDRKIEYISTTRPINSEAAQAFTRLFTKLEREGFWEQVDELRFRVLGDDRDG